MENNYTYSEKLVRYMDGELSEADAKALETELQSNTAMQQEMDNLLLAKAVIKNYGATKKLSSIHQAMMEEMKTHRPVSKPVVRSLPKMMLRIAAGIIVLAGLFGLYQYFTVSPGNLYNEQYMAYETVTMRGATATGNLEKAYSEKKYDTVIALYKQTANPAVNEAFLAAQSYLIKADYNNAIITFNTVIEKNKAAGTATLNDDAEYYLALSYLKNNEAAKALPLFKKIHDDKEHLYHEKINGWYLAKVKLLNWKN